ncbi:epoxyqueuosine reductase QueH [uncultured Olsenella sp.]|uniref:epoxyqueuosine reductase QueH n=1 Tax=uncultured Olsenella sp. TaxID=190764 RepID=UPI0026DDAF70|nr:epoxyqueuosine reductase QueH [uncultured Olsenella sp.]
MATDGRGVPLLLHACCGPCSLEPLRLLREDGFEPTICWSNPNIQPVAEHDRRLRTLLDWARDVAHVEVVVAGDDRGAWERGVAPAGFDRERRCRSCYALRLAESCRVARERGFEYVSTTLAVSPYQLFDACEDVLLDLARANGLTAVWRDFRPHYAEATIESRELGMYRQNYCGCRFSSAEAAMERQRARDARKAARAARREGRLVVAPPEYFPG